VPFMTGFLARISGSSVILFLQSRFIVVSSCDGEEAAYKCLDKS